MSFFKKLVDKAEELFDGDDDKKKKGQQPQQGTQASTLVHMTHLPHHIITSQIRTEATEASTALRPRRAHTTAAAVARLPAPNTRAHTTVARPHTSSNHRATAPLPRSHKGRRRRTGRRRPCRPAGTRSGTRARTGGTTSSKRRGARSGIRP